MVYKLTRNNPEQISGISDELIGWHFIGAEAIDIFRSFDILDRADWDYAITKDPDNRKLQLFTLTKGLGTSNKVRLETHDTQWAAFDANWNGRILDEVDVGMAPDTSKTWTATHYTLPPPPAPPNPPNNLVAGAIQGSAPGASVRLTWDAIENAMYTIARSRDSTDGIDGTWRAGNPSMTESNDVTETGLPTGTVWFRVMATVNGVISGPSNAISVIVP